jgi:hypothetical protein
LSAAGMVASRGFSDLLCSIGASFGFGELALDAGWLFSLAESGEYYSGGAGSYAPRLLPALSIRYDSSSRMRAGDYGAAFGVSARPFPAMRRLSKRRSCFHGDQGHRRPGGIDRPDRRERVLRKDRRGAADPRQRGDPSGIGAWEIAMYGKPASAISRPGTMPLRLSPRVAGAVVLSAPRREGTDPAPRALRRLPEGCKAQGSGPDLRGNESRPQSSSSP